MPPAARAAASPGLQRFERAFAAVARLCAGLAALAGTLVLLGWILDEPLLKGGLPPHGITVKTNTGLAMLLAGLGLHFAAGQRSPARLRVARACALLALSLGALTLLEHLGDWDFRIDQAFFEEPRGEAATVSPNRMGPPASICFTLIGVALLCATSRSRRRRVLAQGLALAVGLLALFPAIGYLYGVEQLFGIARFTGISLPTAVVFLLLALGTLCAVPDGPLCALAASPTAGGLLLRRLVLPVVALPVVLGYVVELGQQRLLYDGRFGTAFLAVALIIVFACLVWSSARALERQAVESERVRHERRAFEERLNLAVLEANMGMWDVDLETGVAVWSASHFEMLGYRPRPGGTATLEMWLERIHPEDREHVLATVTRAREERALYRALYRILSADTGEVRWLDAFGRFLYDGVEQPVRFVGIFFDATEAKQAEEKLRASEALLRRAVESERRLTQEREELLDSERAARREAEHASRLKDEFLATVSHELRTPLNAILGWSQLLARPDALDAENVRKGIETITRNARVQAQLIEDLLDMSRIISGKIRLDVRRVDLDAVIDAALESVESAAREKGIRVERVPARGAGFVQGDPARLEQVLCNLLSNAVKFTPAGGRVDVAVERRDARVALSVHDTGRGIRPDFLPHLFGRFRQADASTTREQGGLGLGLAIVKNIVQLHGGTVSAESAGEGLGATFVVELPETLDHGLAEPRAERPPRAGSVELDGARVLVVDDEPDARDMIQRVLEECQASVVTAASADEALLRVAEGGFDVLIADIGMPVKDGYALIRELRQRENGSESALPAVALTAFARAEDRERALEAGFDLHLAKPIEPVELTGVIANLVRRFGM